MTAVSLHAYDRFTSGLFTVRGDLILRFVRKERRFGINASGRQPASAGYEQPVVGAADQAHEKRGHLFDMGDAVIVLAKSTNVAPFNRLCFPKNRRITDHRCTLLNGHQQDPPLTSVSLIEQRL